MSARKSKPTYAEKRKQWLEALSGDDRNSIINQLIAMTLDEACFRVINEARRLAPEDSEGGVQLSLLVHRLIDRTFFKSQMAAIRRLLDSDRCTLDGKSGVCSLTALLNDMKKFFHLITRAAVFEVEGLHYDYKSLMQKEMEYARARVKDGGKGCFVPIEIDSASSRDRHRQFDLLAGVDEKNRSPEDTVHASVFENLKRKVKGASKEVTVHVNKFIAHAATPGSREIVRADEAKITLGHLRTAHRCMCQTASFLDAFVLGNSAHTFLARPQFDQFKNIEKPLVAEKDIDALQKVWDEFEEECFRLGQWGLEDYKKEFGNIQKEGKEPQTP